MPGLISAGPLHVLLVSTSVELNQEVDAALRAGAGDVRYFWVSQPDLALVRGQGLAPHVILVDDELEDVLGLVRQLRAGVSQAALLVLVSAGAQGLALAQSAMLAGASAFVFKPVQPDELASTLRQVLSRPRVSAPVGAEVQANGRVIVFCASKGGTGRTTLAINTAVSLRQALPEQVVLVDADYAAPALDVALNLPGQHDLAALLPKLGQLDANLISGVLASHSSGVKVLLAPPDMLGLRPTPPQVQQVVTWLRRMFSWVLIDLGLPLDEMGYAFLDLADRVIVSIPPEMVGLRNTRWMLAQFAERGYAADKVWPLLNREGMAGSLARRDVEAVLGQELYHAVPDDQVLATGTINSGVPMVISHRGRPVSWAYRSLAAKLVTDRRTVLAQAVPVARPAEAHVVAAEPLPARGIPTAVPAPAAAPVIPAAGPSFAPPTATQPAPAAQTTARPAWSPWTDRRLRWILTPASAIVVAVLLVALGAPWLIGRFSQGSDRLTPAAATVMYTPGATRVAIATATAAATPQPSSTIAPLAGLASSPPPGVAVTTAQASAVTASASPTSTSSRSATAMPSQTPTPTQTATRPPTATPTMAPSATNVPSETPTPTTTPTPTATRTATRRPAATSTPVLSEPALSSPFPNETAGGVVTFRWLPTGPLPTGAAYEVVWWNDDEDPSMARGIAPPTTTASLSADLDVLYASGMLRTSVLRWTVLIVRVQPYARLTQPRAGLSHPLVYRAGEAPPPPRP